VHEHCIADPHLTLSIKANKFSEPRRGPEEPESMHGAGVYHIDYSGGLTNSPRELDSEEADFPAA
jgi:hypothetical protein